MKMLTTRPQRIGIEKTPIIYHISVAARNIGHPGSANCDKNYLDEIDLMHTM